MPAEKKGNQTVEKTPPASNGSSFGSYRDPEAENQIAVGAVPRFPPYASVIVLNFNGHRFLQACLQSLKVQRFRDFEVILVDNGSTDSSVAYVRDGFPEVRVVEIGRNLGFSGGVNRGIRSARGRLIVLLNNDTEVEAGWLGALADAARKHPEAGMFASLLLDPSGRVQSAGDGLTAGGLAFNVGKGDAPERYGAERFVLGCTGAAAAYRRELLDDVGLFDEALFAFYEDVDLDLRAQLRGWKCIYVPQARLTHYGGGSFAYFSPLHLMLFLRNRFLVLLKDFPLALLWLLRRDLWRQTVASLRWATGRIRSDRGFLRAAAFLLQLGHGTLRRLPGAVLKRFKIQSRATLNSRQLQHLLVKSEAEER